MTKKNHLETRIVLGRIKDKETGKWKKAYIPLDFVSGTQPLFTEEQIQEIEGLLRPKDNYSRPAWTRRGPDDQRPPRKFDPMQEIVLATKFFLPIRRKKIEAYATSHPKIPSKVRQDLDRLWKTTEKLYKSALDFSECLADMHEETLKILERDPDWQEEKEKWSFEISIAALILLKEYPSYYLGHRRYELEVRFYLAGLIMIYEDATGRAAGSKGRFLKLVKYILNCIDPKQDIILQTEDALINRIKATKKYINELEQKALKARQRKTILTSRLG